MKRYILMLSKTFPSHHPKHGQPTGFERNVLDTLSGKRCYKSKIHTMRGKYELWEKRFRKINSDKAYISLCVWSGIPYKSKVIEIARLTKKDGIGLQKAKFSRFSDGFIYLDLVHIDGKDIDGNQVAANDGLSYNDWATWFLSSKYDLSEPLAIIHFTKSRY